MNNNLYERNVLALYSKYFNSQNQFPELHIIKSLSDEKIIKLFRENLLNAIFSEENITESFQKILKIPPFKENNINPELSKKLLTFEQAYNNGILIESTDSMNMNIIITHPGSIGFAEQLALKNNKNAVCKICPRNQLNQLIRLIYNRSNYIKEIDFGSIHNEQKLETIDILSQFNQQNINTEFSFEKILQQAIQSKSSDIHIESSHNSYTLKFRIDGILQTISQIPKIQALEIISKIKILSNLSISEKRLPQDGNILQYQFEGSLFPDLRVSIVPALRGENVAIRMMNDKHHSKNLNNIGLNTSQINTVKKIIEMPDGLLLICGPTGSGKSTSIYACLNHLNVVDRKIITVEDPVEYSINGISQVNIHNQIGLTFSTTLKTILRQSPNVIMIGEIRDHDTANVAVNASLTGHFVISTLHTGNAIQAITRMTDLGIKPYLLAPALRALIAQRLVRVICQDCKNSNTPCKNCNNTKYRGRIGVFEIIKIDDMLRNLIATNTPIDKISNYLKNNGHITLHDACQILVKNNITDNNECKRVIG